MPNALAYAALLVWPLVAIVLFARMRADRALIWTLLGGYLLLPPLTSIAVPLIPDFDKVTIPSLVAFGIAVPILGHRLRPFDGTMVERMLLVLFVVAPIGTVLTNADPLHYGPLRLPALQLNDAVGMVSWQLVQLLPFLLARRLVAHTDSHRELLLAFAVAGLAYSLPMLVEVRLSPQLNTWIYGFFQHSFGQMMRDGGFRPIVFLEHGLWVALFAAMAVLAAAALARTSAGTGRSVWLAASAYLAIVLVLCKSLAALLYMLALAPLVALASRRIQLLVATALVLVALMFPLLRGADLVPVDLMVQQAGAVEDERAESLRFRFDNEDALLVHARERPLFGWGTWGRNQLYDSESGRMTSVTDGRWIIAIGIAGWAGFIAEFGLLAWPVLLLIAREWRRRGTEASPYVGPLALILGINMIDMLPNATLTPLTWLLAGAVMGYANRLGARAPGTIAAPSRVEVDPGTKRRGPYAIT